MVHSRPFDVYVYEMLSEDGWANNDVDSLNHLLIPIIHHTPRLLTYADVNSGFSGEQCLRGSAVDPQKARGARGPPGQTPVGKFQCIR